MDENTDEDTDDHESTQENITEQEKSKEEVNDTVEKHQEESTQKISNAQNVKEENIHSKVSFGVEKPDSKTVNRELRIEKAESTIENEESKSENLDSDAENSDTNEVVNVVSKSYQEKSSDKFSVYETKITSRSIVASTPKRLDPSASGPTGFGTYPCNALFEKRNPFNHDPPRPEERRARIQNPRTPKEYIINLREDLADFQESHGLPRTRDYSFLSLGLALAQETARALCSLFFMFIQLFPILAIVSLILRFALDKLIEILETTDPVQKTKKSIIFGIQMLLILIPLWIFFVTILIPLMALIFSIFKRICRFKGSKGGKTRRAPPPRPKEKKKTDCLLEYIF